MYRFTSICSLALLLFAPHALGMEPTTPLISTPQLAVTASDMDALLAEGPVRARITALGNRSRMDTLSEQLMLTRLAARDAERLGLEQTPLVQAQLRRLRERFLMNLRLKALDAEPLPDFSAAAKERYTAFPEQYREGETVSVSHILIGFKDSAGEPRDESQALEIAESVRQELVGGADFATLAQQYSDDPSVAENQGDLGSLPRGKTVPEFDAAAFALTEPGQLSEPVATKFGYHIIKLHSHSPGRQKSFEEVKDEILSKLAQDLRQSRRQDYLAGLRAEGKPVIQVENLDAYIEDRTKGVIESAEQR